MEPTPNRVRPLDRARFAQEYEKRRLKGVVCVIGIVEIAQADVVEHLAVAIKQHLKRCFREYTLPRSNSFDQLTIGQTVECSRSHERL
jgi:hypothetical protein